MIYTPLTNKALILCFAAHKDQTDKSGIPYVFHPFHLAEQMDSELTTHCMQLRLLHINAPWMFYYHSLPLHHP